MHDQRFGAKLPPPETTPMQYSLVVLYVLITSYIKVYVSDTEAVEACIRFVDDDDDTYEKTSPYLNRTY